MQELSILGGSLEYSLINNQDSDLLVDIYDLFDLDVRSNSEILMQRYVPLGWNQLVTSLNRKFKLRPRLGSYVLRSGESLNFSANHRFNRVQVSTMMKRRAIPCYLTILGGLNGESRLEFSFKNTLKYITHRLPEFENLSPWDGS